MAKVIVGLSGGVDSAVTAYLMLQQQHEVHAVFMQNWDDGNDTFCSAAKDYSMAQQVSAKLDIPLTYVNFSKEYYEKVFQHCLDAFKNGLTPNPDILCNQEIKFKIFLNHAISLGADYIATGHYAKIDRDHHGYQLKKACERSKDQSYFLYTLTQDALSKSLFPLGDYASKEKIREIAKNIGLPNYDRKDSTGICFIGERPFKNFLSDFLRPKPGHMVDEHGHIIGQHDGLMFYTIGQRNGLGLGGIAGYKESPWYVLEKDIKTNQLILGQDNQHPKLFSSELICTNIHWSHHAPKLPYKCFAKTRYRQQDCVCKVETFSETEFKVIFEEKQRAITPGQSIVFYLNEQCLGGAIITKSID